MARRPHPIQRLERILDRLRTEVETDIEAELADSGMLLSGIEVDLVDRGDELAVLANVPGCDKEDVSVTAEEDRLVVAADVPERSDEGELLRQERPHRTLRRIVRLPSPVDADAATATVEHGVLEAVLPKTDDTDGTTIEIE